ncbi:phage virion morphogenesis protein [Shinella zoogloeoides]|uniref:Phage morphogenesis protein n=1 Tax=Shinella zoogloeoides TaxID=352475 RepID=A0A6N8TE87_SHIZO|nr:phage virion morphogenesis protein [Shinella zoogloeoides]MXO01583.1 phage morphogenesis protein [Shinella zoogloeoides]UEX80179.1 phage virion morphogenesis protein [Shinella zoogloeoides]
MSFSITLDASDLDDARLKLRRWFDFEPSELMTNIAAIGENQTRRRIAEEKTAPDGTPWKPNSQDTSILMQTGQHLLASVASFATASEAQWGAAWEYAHVHQEGMTIVPKSAEALVFQLGGETIRVKQVTIPARPFVGISDENAREIVDAVTDFFGLLP